MVAILPHLRSVGRAAVLACPLANIAPTPRVNNLLLHSSFWISDAATLEEQQKSEESHIENDFNGDIQMADRIYCKGI